MKTMSKLVLLFLLALCPRFIQAQVVTPNTTLCAPVSLTANTICLTATSGSSPTWSISNQTGVYVDNEYMLVVLSNSQTVTGSNQYVQVARSNRSGPGAPADHASGAVAWIANIPTSGIVPGDNGFVYGTQLGDVGACVRANIQYLPHIWVDKGIKRDCSSSSATAGQWVNYNEQGDPSEGGVQTLTAATITISPTSANYVLNGAATETLTLAAPTAGIQDGTLIRISSNTAHAHVVSASGLILNGATGGPFNTATLAAFPGAGITLMAYGGKWVVVYSVGTVTYA